MNELYFSDLGITMYTIPSDEGHRKGEGRGGEKMSYIGWGFIIKSHWRQFLKKIKMSFLILKKI